MQSDYTIKYMKYMIKYLNLKNTDIDDKNKYIKYKKKYLELKNDKDTQYDVNHVYGGKKVKCGIEKTDKILFGDGGSYAIIIITKDNRVYKIFTFYNYLPSLNLKNNIDRENIGTRNEIKIYELLTKNIINKNVSKHIVKYLGTNECTNASKLFKKCPKTYAEFMKIDAEKKDKMCSMYFRNYPSTKLNSTYSVVEIEYCNYSCADFIRDISQLPGIEMEKYLDIFFFQIIHTIVSIQDTYPYFTHNDLFMRNILGIAEKDNNNYYTYKFNDKTYYVPQKKFFPKINDFGMTNLNDKYKNVKLFKSEYKDIYCIILDVYNGGNIGSKSLTTLCKDDPDKLKFLNKYFSNYFDVNVIDEYIEKSKNHMDWDWDVVLADDFLSTINMKNPTDLLDGYFYDIFEKINQEIE